jgi:hypothetical protein
LALRALQDTAGSRLIVKADRITISLKKKEVRLRSGPVPLFRSAC